MRGTILCGVNDSETARSALELAAELSVRLGLPLVVAHVADGIAPVGGDGNGDESVTARANREGAARLVARLSAEHRVTGDAKQRSAVGDPAVLLGQIAAEEAADVILIGSRGRGRLRRGLASKLARQLAEAPVPVLIALPRTTREPRAAA